MHDHGDRGYFCFCTRISRRASTELEEFSKDYDELYFQIALNYGSRDEITRGVTKDGRGCSRRKAVRPDEITERQVLKAIWTQQACRTRIF